MGHRVGKVLVWHYRRLWGIYFEISTSIRCIYEMKIWGACGEIQCAIITKSVNRPITSQLSIF